MTAACLGARPWQQNQRTASDAAGCDASGVASSLSHRCRSVALTVPAYVAADLVSSSCPEAAKGLKSLDYPPVAAVTVAYPLTALRQDRLDAAGKLPGAPL